MKSKILFVAACMWFTGSASAVQTIEQGGVILVADSNAVVPADLDFSACGVVIGVNNAVNIVDVSGCQLAQEANACLAVANLASGSVSIPCVALKGAEDTEYVVNMVQRGSSMNWDVTFVDYNYRKQERRNNPM
ncbi:MAG: hypothetical protein ABIG70_13300 [Pseudomonadota bacterium]